MSFGRERALYQLISIKKAQIQILRDHIKKSNRRTYFSFVINLIIRVSSNPEEKFRKFPGVVWTGEVGFVHNSKNFECLKNNTIRKRTFKFKFWVIIWKNRKVEHIFLLQLISLLRSPLTLRKNLGNFPVSFERERALYQLIYSEKAQIQTLRDHIKKSNSRTYFPFVINLIIKVSSNPEEKFRKFPPVVWTGEGGFVHNSKNFECLKK